MNNKLTKCLAKVNNGTGFFLDNRTLATAAHNINQNGVYDIRTDNEFWTCQGYLHNQVNKNISDTLKNGDLQIIFNDNFLASNYIPACSYSSDNKYYLIGRRFQYPCFKHYENIHVYIRYIIPLELDYLNNLKKSFSRTPISLQNRTRQLVYCLQAWPKNTHEYHDFVYKRSSLNDLKMLHNEYNVTYWDALLDELSIFINLIINELNNNPSFYEAAQSAYYSICSMAGIFVIKNYLENNHNSLIKNCIFVKEKLLKMTSPSYKSRIDALSNQIVKSYYSQIGLADNFHSDYLITVTDSDNIGKKLTDKLVEISAPTYPGFSGGPLIDINGNVQGLVVGGLKDNLLSTLIPFQKNVKTIGRFFS